MLTQFLCQVWNFNCGKRNCKILFVHSVDHPNCRLFITHGGLHSLLESVNSSVPVVGLPFFSDQQHNMALVEYYEIGLTLQTDEIETNLLKTVQEVLKNPKYVPTLITFEDLCVKVLN